MLPNLIIIGAPKCGTTSLHHYLGQHPEISMAVPSDPSYPPGTKEMRYFWRDDWRERRDWYERHFSTSTPICGEATPGYAQFPFLPSVPERMHSLVPDAKLIYLVRDPIDRIVSHWMELRTGREIDPLERYIANADRLDNPIVCASRYALQIRRYLAYFSSSQLLIVDQQDLRAARAATLAGIFKFLGVDAKFTSTDFETERNKRGDKRAISGWKRQVWNRAVIPTGRIVPQSARRRLRTPIERLLASPVEPPTVTPIQRSALVQVLQPEVTELRQLTTQSFSMWSV